MGNSHKNLLVWNLWVAQLEPNFDQIAIGWSSSKIVSGGPALWPSCLEPVAQLEPNFDGIGHHGRRDEPPDTFLEDNHPMTISSKFCTYWANGFRQEDFYGNFP
jgi:hypothetical protein